MTAFDKAWNVLKSNTYGHSGEKEAGGPYDWQGQEFDSHCPKCRKGIYVGSDDAAIMSMVGSCADCL